MIHDCLAVIHLAEGDYAAYVAAQSRVADLRQNATLRRRVALVSQALSDSPQRASEVLLDFARADVASGESRTRAWSAFIASVARDKPSLLAILGEAEERKERWGDAGLLRAMRSRWAGDAGITALLARLDKS